MVHNQNPTYYFTQVEQLAFCPAHLVPSIEPSQDKMLQVGGGGLCGWSYGCCWASKHMDEVKIRYLYKNFAEALKYLNGKLFGEF